jgi:hypothetical protein
MAGFLLPVLLLIPCSVLYGQPDPVISGVNVSFSTRAGMFPRKWYRKKIHAQAESLPDADIPRVTGILTQALAKYPDHLAAEYVDHVYVLRSIRFYGLPYGGTYARRTIYLSFESDNSTNTNPFLEERFHHELSSLLWRENRRKLDLRQWNSFNARGFEYGEGGTEALSDGLASMENDPGYYNIGFLNRYAMSDIEQDINVMAQNLFDGGKGFWEAFDSNARIRGKAMLLIGFYHSLDPAFSESYFRAFSR